MTNLERSAHASLPERLFLVSQHHAAEMLSLASVPWSEVNAIDVAIRAGSALELLAKALLAEVDERLIAKGEDAHHHLLDATVGSGVKLAARAARRSAATVDANVAIALASRLDPALARYEGGARRVAQARNAAIHLAGAAGEVPLKGLVADAIVYINAATVALSRRVDQFWGGQYATANEWVSKHTEDVSTEARRLVKAASDAYLRSQRVVRAEAWPVVIEMLQRRPVLLGADLEASVDCPACQNEAAVGWTVDVDAEDDHGEAVYYAGYLLDGLACPVCGLELDGEHVDALELSNLPSPEDAAADSQGGNEEYFPGGEDW